MLRVLTYRLHWRRHRDKGLIALEIVINLLAPLAKDALVTVATAVIVDALCISLNTVGIDCLKWRE